MLQIGTLKGFNSTDYRAEVQLAGSMAAYLDNIPVARNINAAAMAIGNFVLVAIPEDNPKDACVVATWPGGTSYDPEISQPTPENLKHAPHGYYAAGGVYKPFAVDANGVLQTSGGGGGASTFLALTDTPAAYTGQAGKFARVKADEAALEFHDHAALTLASAVHPNINRVHAYLATANQPDLHSGKYCRIELNATDLDPGSCFKSGIWVSGAADATEANKLHDADGGFVTNMKYARVHNTTDNTWTYVSAFVDSGELTLTDDIFVSGENYEIKHAEIQVAVAGYYLFLGKIEYSWNGMVASKRYDCVIQNNTADVLMAQAHSSNTSSLGPIVLGMLHPTAGDLITLVAWHSAGTNTVQAELATARTYLEMIPIEMD